MNYTKAGLYRRRIELYPRYWEEHLIYYTPWVRHDDNPEKRLDEMQKYLTNFGWKYVKSDGIVIGTEFREYEGR